MGIVQEGWLDLFSGPLHDQSHTGRLRITERTKQARRARAIAPLRAQPTRRAEGPLRRCRRTHRTTAHHGTQVATLRGQPTRRGYRCEHSLPTFIATVVHHATFIPMRLAHEGRYFGQQPIA